MADDASMLYVNGINGTRGGYLVPPLNPEQALKLAVVDEQGRGDHMAELVRRNQRESLGSFGVDFGIDPSDLSQTGWGVILPHDLEPAVREAIAPLLELRRGQATAKGRETYYREYVYQPGETKQAFLARNRVAVGMPANPEAMPYYLLIVGDPERISYRFQYELDVEYAVGRIAFDTPQEYYDYAQSLVAAETGAGVVLPRRAVFLAAKNRRDRATELSSTSLVPPLREALTGGDELAGWSITSSVGEEVTKDRLSAVLNGGEAPALLFVASHGMGFESDDPRQLRHQGALLTSECPDPFAPIEERYYLSADDVGSEARLLGSIAFFFACYGAGTPRLDDFPHETALRAERQIAPRAFVAPLPRRLLGHPRGGALAVVGHVERAWASSFLLDAATPQIQAFRATLTQLLLSVPIGAAMEWFNQKYAALATALTSQLQPVSIGMTPSPSDLLRMATLWTAHNDARSYVILGDPAVRLKTGEASTTARPTLGGARVPEVRTAVPTPVANPPAGASAVVSGPPPAPTSGARPPIPPDLIDAVEARFKSIQGDRPASFATGAGTSADLLRSNPPDAIVRRLGRAGISPDQAEAIANRSANESFVTGIRAQTAGLVGLERILGRRSEIMGIRYLDNGQLAARTVGRIVIGGSGGRTVGYGTGWLVTPRLLITNNHVLDAVGTARRSAVEFDYQDGPDGRPLQPSTFRLDPDRFFFTSPYNELDFTLVAVRETSDEGRPLADFGHNRLGALTGEILAGESVTIIQHPNGEPKQIALRENLVLKVPEGGEQFLYYQTDTNPGSSGSPVYNDQWEVVALHHAGFPRKDASGHILARDGRVWRQETGEQEIDWIANEGVRVAAIVDRLRHLNELDADRQALVSPILEAAAAEVAGPAVPAGQPAPPAAPTSPAGLQPVLDLGSRLPHASVVQPSSAAVSPAAASWTVPITITIQLNVAVGRAVLDAHAAGGGPPPAPDGA